MKKTLQFPDSLKRCCDICGLDETDKEFNRSNCADSRNGKHRLVPYELWAAVSHQLLYGIRSEQRALRCFTEACGGTVESARKLTPLEVSLLREGRAKLSIQVIPI